MDIICGSRPRCGFRVDGEYYRNKPKFRVRICARCNGPIEIVDEDTEDRIRGATMNNQGVVHVPTSAVAP